MFGLVFLGFSLVFRVSGLVFWVCGRTGRRADKRADGWTGRRTGGQADGRADVADLTPVGLSGFGLALAGLISVALLHVGM